MRLANQAIKVARGAGQPLRAATAQQLQQQASQAAAVATYDQVAASRAELDAVAKQLGNRQFFANDLAKGTNPDWSIDARGDSIMDLLHRGTTSPEQKLKNFAAGVRNSDFQGGYLEWKVERRLDAGAKRWLNGLVKDGSPAAKADFTRLMKQIGFKDDVIADAWASGATWHVEGHGDTRGEDVRLVAVKPDGTEAAAAMFECKLKAENGYQGTEIGQLSQSLRQVANLLFDGKRVDVVFYVVSRLGSEAPKDGPTISIQRIMGMATYDKLKNNWPNLRGLLETLPASTLKALEAGEGFPRGVIRWLNGLAAPLPALFSPADSQGHRNYLYAMIDERDGVPSYLVKDPDTNEVQGRILPSTLLAIDPATGQLSISYMLQEVVIHDLILAGNHLPSTIPALLDPSTYGVPTRITVPLGYILTDAQHDTLVSAVNIISQIVRNRMSQGWYITPM